MTLTISAVQVSSIVRSFTLALTYGVYVTTSIHCLRWLVRNDGGYKRWNAIMLTVFIALFLLLTTALASYLKATFVVQDLDRKGYNIFNIIYNVAESSIYQVVDAVLIYRCWVVYGHAWKIIYLLIFFWISGMGLTGYGLYLYSLEASGVTNKLLSRASQIWGGFFACNIVLNIYATVAIVCRIASVARRSNNSSARFHQTWHIVAESGALYTLSSIINLVAVALFSQNPNSERNLIFLAVIDPMVCHCHCAFLLCMFRV
ncbi:hypothetical protein AX15_002047 [Amanita polypyramis BW_CC]|nr:hypothetical protein AX15_002047 [Amanita polypyramis BW_CC]